MEGSSSEFSSLSLVVEGAFWGVSIGCLPLVLTLNLLLILGEVRKFVVLTPKAEGVFLEGRVLLSVEGVLAPEVVVALDDVRVVEVDSCEAGLTLKGCLMGCLCLATNLDEDLVEGITASVELSVMSSPLEEASLAFVFKLTLPLCLIRSLRVLMASLLVDGALVVLGTPAVEGLNLWEVTPGNLVLDRDRDAPRELDRVGNWGGAWLNSFLAWVVCGGRVIDSTTAKLRKSLTLLG